VAAAAVAAATKAVAGARTTCKFSLSMSNVTNGKIQGT
jgi:hypothetical protein